MTASFSALRTKLSSDGTIPTPLPKVLHRLSTNASPSLLRLPRARSTTALIAVEICERDTTCA